MKDGAGKCPQAIFLFCDPACRTCYLHYASAVSLRCIKRNFVSRTIRAALLPHSHSKRSHTSFTRSPVSWHSYSWVHRLYLEARPIRFLFTSSRQSWLSPPQSASFATGDYFDAYPVSTQIIRQFEGAHGYGIHSVGISMLFDAVSVLNQ